mgnify:CR=1 FL=1
MKFLATEKKMRMLRKIEKVEEEHKKEYERSEWQKRRLG